MIGELLDGRYLIQERLGGGRFGVVHRAEQRVLGVRLRAVAVKLLNPDADGPAAPDALVQEVLRVTRVIEDCPDPYVRDRFLAYHDAGLGDRPYLVMELGRHDLARHTGGGRHAVDQVRGWLREICAGAAFLHARGIVHLDLKPANVVVSRTGALKIADFGSAVRAGVPTDGRGVGGTLIYQPPETLDGAPPVPAADVYAIGMIAYELLTGHLPHEQRLHALAGDGADVAPRMAELSAHKRRGVPPPGALDPVLDGDPIEHVVLRALDPMVSRRFSDAGEMLRALDGTRATASPAAGPALVRELTALLHGADRAGDRDTVLTTVADGEAANDELDADRFVTAFYPAAVGALLALDALDEARRVARAGLGRRRCRDTVGAMAAAYAGTALGRTFAREFGNDRP